MSEVKNLQVVMSARPPYLQAQTAMINPQVELSATLSPKQQQQQARIDQRALHHTKNHMRFRHTMSMNLLPWNDEKIQGIKEQMREFRKQDISSLEHVHSLLLQCHNISDNRISPALRGQGARLDNTVSRLTSVAHEAEQSDLLLNQLEDANKLIHVPTS
jgi:hypothetical protein